MTISRPPRILRRLLGTVATIAFWLLLWWGCAALYARPFLFPPPSDVLRAFGPLLRDPSFYRSVGSTLLHVAVGLSLGSAVGILCGILIARFRAASLLLSPAFSVARATPIVCFILLAWIFLGPTVLPAFVSGVMIAPIMLAATAGALRGIDPRMRETVRIYRLSFVKRVRALYLPALLPHLRNAFVTCVGIAWKSTVAAEMITLAGETVGYSIWLARTWYMDYASVFAWTIIIVAVSMGIERAAAWLLSPRKGGAA